MDMEELRRICREEVERARQLRKDELNVPKQEEPSTMNQLMSQICTLQDKVNSLNEEKEFFDPETASSSGIPHVPSQPSRIPSLRHQTWRDQFQVGMICAVILGLMSPQTKPV